MKKFFALVLSLVMVLSLAACGAKEEPASEKEEAPNAEQEAEAPAGEIKVGASMFDLSDPYFVSIADGVKAAAEDYGVDLIMDDPAADTQKQVNSIENFMISEVDGMIISAVEPESINNLLKDAQDKGVKILAQNHPVEYYDCFVTILEYDYGYAGGVVAGEWIKETYGDEAIEVGIIGASLHTTGVERTQGLKDGILSIVPNVQIVTEQDGQGLTEKAMNVAENMLQAYPNLKCIACFDDLAALGAYEAVNANKTEEEQKAFGVFGLDAVDQALEAIAEGGAYKGTVDIAPYDTGYMAMELLLKSINGEEVEKQVLQGMVGVTAANIGDYIK